MRHFKRQASTAKTITSAVVMVQQVTQGNVAGMPRNGNGSHCLLIKDRGYPLPNRIRMLDAHGRVLGEVQEDHWLYLDCHGRHFTYRKVEDWIRNNETQYDALYILCCNHPEQPYIITPKSSFVVYPREFNRDLASIILAIKPESHSAQLPSLEIVAPRDYIPATHPEEENACRRIEMLISLRDKL